MFRFNDGADHNDYHQADRDDDHHDDDDHHAAGGDSGSQHHHSRGSYATDLSGIYP